MGREGGVVEGASDSLGREANRGNFFDDNTKGFTFAERYFYDMSRAERQI